MKQTDFDRLKAVCEKEGFEILNLTHDDNEKYVLVKKQNDIWEGVEFFEFKGNHFKVKEFYPTLIRSFYGLNYEKKHCKPSTEQAYIEQLKAEAFKRFGKIKEGEKFQMADGGIYTFGKTRNIEWDYFKKVDQFFHYNVELYFEGKWATRVKERVKVVGAEINKQKMTFYYTGKIDEMIGNISIKLEKYLNKD